MLRRFRYRTAMWRDGFTTREVKTALRLLDAGNHAVFIRYCRDVIRRKASHAIALGQPFGATLDAYF